MIFTDIIFIYFGCFFVFMIFEADSLFSKTLMGLNAFLAFYFAIKKYLNKKG